tara:strand:+ start:399 stop:890 length:492 start_codon:yes stop_codon:yes gene_type:complete
MIKKIIFSFILYSIIFTSAYAAGSSDSGSSNTKSNYDKAVKLIKIAKNFEKKEKIKNANKNYEKAHKLLIKFNNNNPNEADTLNYLGFTTRKLGDYKTAEQYYLQGLSIEPNHIGINEYLGELYVATNRHNLALERLEVLNGCNCKEYKELKDIIAGKKVSKY